MPLTQDQMTAFGAMGWLPPGMTAATAPKLQSTTGLPDPQANPDMQGPGAAGAAAHDAAAAAGLSPEAAAGQAAGQSAYDQAAKAGPAGGGGMSKQEAMAMIQGFQSVLKAASPKPVNVPPPITAPQPQTMQIAPLTSGGPNPSWQ